MSNMSSMAKRVLALCFVTSIATCFSLLPDGLLPPMNLTHATTVTPALAMPVLLHRPHVRTVIVTAVLFRDAAPAGYPSRLPTFRIVPSFAALPRDILMLFTQVGMSVVAVTMQPKLHLQHRGGVLRQMLPYAQEMSERNM